MGVFRQFPYSNFHEMNMDEILKILKTMSEEWDATKTEWASYKDFIDNYFANLDVSAEVLSALRTMATTGELGSIMNPTIASETAEWLAEHITPTSPAVDDTLTISGAAADAKVSGEKINEVRLSTRNHDTLFEKFNNIVELTSETGVYDKNHTLNTGVGMHATIEVNPGEKYRVIGHNYNANTPVWIVFDTNYNLLWNYSSSNNETVDSYADIPSNGKYLVINAYHPYYFLCYKLVNKSIKNSMSNENFIQILPTIEDGYIAYNKVVNHTSGCHTIFDVVAGDEVIVTGFNLSTSYPLGYCWASDGTNLQTLTGGVEYNNRVYEYRFTVPKGCIEIGINSDDIRCLRVYIKKAGYVVELARKNTGVITEQKKIVWLGTSIPHGYYQPNNPNTSYPKIIGERLGITVYNEAIPRSPVHGRRQSQISENNPYGFMTENFSTCALALADDLTLKEWLINHYNDDIWTGGRYSTMTTELAESIRNSSYERIIDKYLNNDMFPDAFVFDTGRNDIWGNEDTLYTGVNGYTFQNAISYLIEHIYKFRKDAKILIVGHYSNQERASSDTVIDFPKLVSECQENISKTWQIPICKTWEHTGWCNVEVTQNGTTKSMLAWNIPDQLHPHSDSSGKATRIMADAITPFIRDNI